MRWMSAAMSPTGGEAARSGSLRPQALDGSASAARPWRLEQVVDRGALEGRDRKAVVGCDEHEERLCPVVGPFVGHGFGHLQAGGAAAS